MSVADGRQRQEQTTRLTIIGNTKDLIEGCHRTLNDEEELTADKGCRRRFHACRQRVTPVTLRSPSRLCPVPPETEAHGGNRESRVGEESTRPPTGRNGSRARRQRSGRGPGEDCMCERRAATVLPAGATSETGTKHEEPPGGGKTGTKTPTRPNRARERAVGPGTASRRAAGQSQAALPTPRTFSSPKRVTRCDQPLSWWTVRARRGRSRPDPASTANGLRSAAWVAAGRARRGLTGLHAPSSPDVDDTRPEYPEPPRAATAA